MKTKKTLRGFGFIGFKDFYNQECSIQESSIVEPDCIWLGVDNTGPELKGPGGKFNCNVNSRMHLSREQVFNLIPILQKFVDKGELPTFYKELNKKIN